MLEARDETKLSERFGKLIARLREEDPRNLTIRAASKLLGISHTRLRSLEQGAHHETGLPTLPSPELVAKLASLYHIPKQELLLVAGYSPWTVDLDESRRLLALASAEFSGC